MSLKTLYQDVIFTDFEESKRRAIDLKDNLVELVSTSISERLEKSTENFEQHAAVILNTECWPKVSQKEDEADDKCRWIDGRGVREVCKTLEKCWLFWYFA